MAKWRIGVLFKDVQLKVTPTAANPGKQDLSPGCLQLAGWEFGAPDFPSEFWLAPKGCDPWGREWHWAWMKVSGPSCHMEWPSSPPPQTAIT